MPWLVAVLVVLAALGAFEYKLRSMRHQPSVVDDPSLWALSRGNVYREDGRVIVLLGASRIQLGFDTEEFRRVYPDYSVVQLAVDGRGPVATLVDLAKDDKFKGVVICSFLPDRMQKPAWFEQQPYIDYYRNEATLNKKLNTAARTWLEERLVFFNPRFRFDKLASRAIAGEGLPQPQYLVTLADRSRLGDYSLIDIEQLRQYRIQRAIQLARQSNPRPPRKWLEEAMVADPWIKELQYRGGEVVFVRYPTSGKHLDVDEAFYPRKSYWDNFAKTTSAQTIHFQDHAELAGFDCPDTSHLDKRDIPKFTNSLLKVLVDKGVLKGG